jgi:hypothetical protein
MGFVDRGRLRVPVSNARGSLPQLLRLESDEWGWATQIGGEESEKRETRVRRHVVATRRLTRSLPLSAGAVEEVMDRVKASLRGYQVGPGRGKLG